ncbi:sensor histidine kinase [Sphaerisporangium fuscum]|uniref:sensor histidine kinase n=1 Tax=Sphaerisporangium fuscum TaxID=2835868 RepID=UPI001BDC89A0|nr:histidine kinase [Sphaerisporangium fuscum]
MRKTQRIASWVQRLSEIALVCWLGLLLLVDTVGSVYRAAGIVRGQFLVPLLGLLAVGTYLLRRRFRVEGFILLAAMSAVVSFAAGFLNWQGSPGFAEAGVLLLLTVGVLRWVKPLRLALVLSGVSMVVLQMAAGLRGPNGTEVAFGFLFFVAWAVAIAIGGYLRYQLERREEAVHAVRRAERLELARELHDLVAHHITGIVVQAQAAKTVAAQKPQAVEPALEAIANAGADALTSMRRLVGVLRAEDDASRQAGTTFADLRLMVEKFSAAGPQVSFEIGQGVTESALAPEVLTTLHRVLQESLTNIRKHAPNTWWVQADLKAADRGVLLHVRNPRSSSDPRVSRLGGGFGLVGMTERVKAVGGDLQAGPTHEGTWEVRAWFPLERSA